MTHTRKIPYYESVEFNVATGTTDYDVDTSEATFGVVFGPEKVAGTQAGKVIIRTNNTISVKFNKTTNPAITIASTDSPFTVDAVEINNMYISNSSGNLAAVKLLLTE